MDDYFSLQPQRFTNVTDCENWQTSMGTCRNQGGKSSPNDQQMVFSAESTPWCGQAIITTYPATPISDTTSLATQQMMQMSGVTSPYSDMYGTSPQYEASSPVRAMRAERTSWNYEPTFIFPATPDVDETQASELPQRPLMPKWNTSVFDASSEDSLHVWNRQHIPIPLTLPTPSRAPAPIRSKEKRARSDSDRDSRSWKAAHNLVERNYRDRLNDQITELSNLLFDGSDDSKGSKPPKSLVISRAKDRLRELATQNKDLKGEVEKLKQDIAILSHVARTNCTTTPPSQSPSEIPAT